MILKPNASRHALTRRAALVSLAAAALGVGTLSALRPAAQAQNNVAAKPTAWKQTLPKGATVELLGVSYPRLSPVVWWKPDGTPLAGQPFGPPTFISVTGRDQRVFDMRVTPPSGLRPEEYNSFPQYEVPGAASVRVNYAIISSNALRMRGLDVVSAGADALPTPGTVRCGIASGPWETLTSQYVIPASAAMKSVNLPYQHSQIDILFSRMTEFGDNAAVTVTTTLPDTQAEWRVQAVDMTGKFYTDSGDGGRLGGKVSQETCVFKGLPRKRVRAFKFQARPYEWAEFTGIAMRPGEK